jgi:uncharacterized membrane protein YdjX (TVP38/TMEM64 family)
MRSPVAAIAASALAVAAIVGVLVWLDVDEQLLELLRWIDGQGLWAALWFVAIMALVVVSLLPGVLFTTGAGFVFGVAEGTIYVVLGTTLGACLAFLIARYGAGDRARAFIRRHAGLHAVTREMEVHDFQVVLLTRLIPFFPGKLSNYFFGLTGFSFRGYSLGTLLGLVPFSLHNVYLGSLAASLVALDDHAVGRTPLEWTIYGVGFLGTVAAVITLNRIARRALERYQALPGEELDS